MLQENFVYRTPLSSEEEEKLRRSIDETWLSGERRVEGEYEKTGEENLFVGLINEYVREECETLGVNGFQAIDSERIHLMNSDSFRAMRRGKEWGHYDPRKDAIYLDKDHAASRIQLYVAMLHEGVHRSSKQKFQVYETRDRKSLVWDGDYRIGYDTFSHVSDNYGERHGHFAGFNEGLTDLIVRDILDRHGYEIGRKLSLTEDEKREGIRYYPYIRLVELIARKVSAFRNESYEETIRRFKRGMFTGEMAHLRDVERIYGPGSLRVLAASYSGVRDVYATEIAEKTFRFFETDDEQERECIANEILNEREREEYFRARKQSGIGGVSDEANDGS